MEQFIESGNYRNPPRPAPPNGDGREGERVAGRRLKDSTLLKLMAIDGLLWCLGALLLLDRVYKAL